MTMANMSMPVLAASALLLSGAVAAQTYKCTDPAGKVTYSGTPCGDLRLKDAGEVKDRINTTPAYKPPAQAVGSRPSPGPAATPAPAAAPSQAADAPAADAPAEGANPDRRCFVVKTAKGNVTRCNDKPD